MEAIRPAVIGPLNLNGSSHTDPDFALPPPPAPFPTELINHSGQTALSEQYLSALQSTCASALASLLPADISNTYGSLTESDRQLATTLTELLEITYELDEMGPSPAYEEVAGPSRANPMSSGPSNGGLEACFTTLLRHLESMDISHNTSTVASDGLEPAVNAARQELALVRIQTLTRVILIQVRARESDALYRYDRTSSNIGDSLGSTSLPDHTSTLPKYDHHDPTRSDDLPDYAEPATRLSIDKKAPAESSSRAQATITSEKTMHDLDNLIAAIERLNSLTSGYSDQRSVLGPRSRSPSASNGKIRHKGNSREERLMTEEEKMGELEDIWRKIESAHGKHRMRDDQRADMDGVQERRAEERGRFLQELYERVEASRLKDQDGIPGVVDGDLARARELRNRDRYLKKLLEVSAESRYSDQDAAAPSDEHARISRQQARQTYIHDLVQRMQSGRLDSQDYPISPDDRIDAKRQDLVDSLVSFSSSGRFADQDSLAPAPRQQNRKDSGEIVTMKDFFKSDPPTTTATNGAMTSGNVVDKEEEKKNGTMKKIKGIMRRSSLGLGLKSTKDLDLSLVHYVVEHQENLNTVTVTLYGPNLPLNTDISIQAHDPASYSLPAVEAILTKDNTSLRIPMPVPIQSHQSVPLMTQGLFLEAKLSALPIAATVPSLISSINHPLSAAELRNIDPRGICCTSCDREIATVPRVLAKQRDMDERFKDLPSEYWAEMMEVWMCHQDPGFTAKLAERTREGFWPAEGKVLAGGSYLLLHQDDLKQANIRNNETDDVSWDAISCSCGEKLGKMRKHDGRPGAGTIRLSKWAISLLRENDEQGEAVQPNRHPLGTYITADMLELAQAHATYRFSIVNEESEKQQILIWLFNPSVRISYRRNSNISAVPPPSPLRNTHTDQSSSKSRRSSMSTASRPVSRGDSMGAATARTIRACKVMYRVTQNDDPQNNGAGQAQIEELKYPSEVIERLLATLKDSTNVYPEGRRKMGIWEVGFLERL